MITTIQPSSQPARWLARQNDETIYEGLTQVFEITGINADYEVLTGEGEVAFLTAVQAACATFPPLPDAGWLEQGSIYQYGTGAVIVRQSHNRTEHDPSTVPALFMVYRSDAAQVLEWVAGESVQVGTQRTYDGKTYRALQAHVTAQGWEPDKTPALWVVVAAPPSEPLPWEQPTGTHDAYKKGDRVTYGGFTWESTIDANVWAPGVYGWVKV